MLRRLFHRESLIVSAGNGIGLVLGIASLWFLRNGAGERGGGGWLHWLALLQFCFINGCAYFPWYRGDPRATRDRYLGIRLHFWKGRVPAAYIAPLHTILYLLWPALWIGLAANLLYGLVSFSNLVLIYLHLRDPHLEPPNLYSTGRYT